MVNRTLRNYRVRMEEDSELADIFHTRKIAFDSQWAESLPVAARRAQDVEVGRAFSKWEENRSNRPKSVPIYRGDGLKKCPPHNYHG